ncbi:MAG: DUF6220 domain-containing protein [Chloroflexota bacterium]|nr:DUF6220 domain-containing protein [Chloroflexota bacterium]
MWNVRFARLGFAILGWLFVALTFVQVYLAGTAVEQLGGTKDFSTHQAMGFVIMIIALVLLLLSFTARLPVKMAAASALLLALMIVQSILVRMVPPNLEALHPVNGFLIALLGLWVAWRGLSFIRAPLPVEPERPVPAPATVPPAPEPHEPKEDDQL